MKDGPLGSFSTARLSEEDFQRLSEFIHGEYGIKLPPAKKVMLESRLQKRLRFLSMADFHEYVEYVLAGEGKEYELIHMIDLVTTNKTDFFREPVHFDFLVQNALPELIRRDGTGLRSPFRLWSAGCSSGEEPYTLAIVLSEFASALEGFRFTILGTDISSRVLETARTAIYDAEKVAVVPTSLKEKYLLRARDPARRQVRVRPELRAAVSFMRLNLMEPSYDGVETMDVVFCRNVIIYFDRPTQEALVNRLCRHLRPEGYLFMGHSETLFSMRAPLRQIAPTIYMRV